ncbi:hypothetical protein AB4Z17_29980 [Paenibacillus sp. TAF43_2]|uniref:hypothetical protein n=1 Tax=Paenibacillus sp. TAF43_2 TaxID=3233069 RepID=UPI003F9E28C5
MDKELSFEEYFARKLQEEEKTIKDLPYSFDELRDIYLQEYEWKRKAPLLDIKMEPQALDYEVAQYFLPERWEMPREGKLLYNDEELLDVLKLLFVNLGAEKGLKAVPTSLIDKYLMAEKQKHLSQIVANDLLNTQTREASSEKKQFIRDSIEIAAKVQRAQLFKHMNQETKAGREVSMESIRRDETLGYINQEILNYGEDIEDLDCSPFEHLRMLHDRSEIQKHVVGQMSNIEATVLAKYDLLLMLKAEEMFRHISKVYDFSLTDAKDIPLTEWWWHLDKVAKGDLKAKFRCEVEVQQEGSSE